MNLLPNITLATKQELSKRVKLSLFNLSLLILFKTVFVLIIPLYTVPAKNMDGPIDGKFFNTKYVEAAKDGGYNACGYFEVYLLLDIAFPIFYTIMFFAILKAFRNKELYYGLYKKAYPICSWMIIAGIAFDYIENSVFSLYLLSNLELSLLVAFLTSIKITLFAINMVTFIAGLIILLLIVWRNRKAGTGNLPTYQ